MKIDGNTLIEMGYSSGKWFGEALDYVNTHNLRGKELRNYLDKMSPPDPLPLKSEAINYKVNIEASTPEEEENVRQVKDYMNKLMLTPTMVDGALMPDACPAGPPGSIPVGGIAVAENAIHPGMHGSDICCSVMLTDFGAESPAKILEAAHNSTHFAYGKRKKGEGFTMPDYLREEFMNNPFLNDEKTLLLADEHLGTQGDGNHFLYVGQSGAKGNTMMVTHHGSRGIGARVFKKAMEVAEKFRRKISPDTLKWNAWIPYDSPDGQDYWHALQLIRKWTKLNHQCIHELTSQKAESSIKDQFWNEHNFVFRKGNQFYHAKGATPLSSEFLPEDKKPRLIPLNMSEPVLLVEGESTDNNLGFAPHGAGRNMSRTRFKRRNSSIKDEELFREQTAGLDIRFFSGEIDISELPSAYKQADNVRQQMKKYSLGTIVDEVIPYGSIMAGNWKKNTPWRS